MPLKICKFYPNCLRHDSCKFLHFSKKYIDYITKKKQTRHNAFTKACTSALTGECDNPYKCTYVHVLEDRRHIGKNTVSHENRMDKDKNITHSLHEEIYTLKGTNRVLTEDIVHYKDIVRHISNQNKELEKSILDKDEKLVLLISSLKKSNTRIHRLKKYIHDMEAKTKKRRAEVSLSKQEKTSTKKRRTNVSSSNENETEASHRRDALNLLSTLKV